MRSTLKSLQPSIRRSIALMAPSRGRRRMWTVAAPAVPVRRVTTVPVVRTVKPECVTIAAWRLRAMTASRMARRPMSIAAASARAFAAPSRLVKSMTTARWGSSVAQLPACVSFRDVMTVWSKAERRMWIVAEPPVPPARAGSAAAQTVTALRIIAQAGCAAGHLVLTVCGMEMSVRWIVVETAKSFVAKARAVMGVGVRFRCRRAWSLWFWAMR